MLKLSVPRVEKRGCKKTGLLVSNQRLERVGDSFSQQALKLSVSRHEKRESGFLVSIPTLRERGGFLLAAS